MLCHHVTAAKFYYLNVLWLSISMLSLYYLYDHNGTNEVDRINHISVSDHESLPVILLVTYREIVLGCGNYHLYPQKEFETIFCLPDDYIKLFPNIDELINNKTYNIHLIKHKQIKGEMWCREKAMNYIINNNKNIDYLLSWNCEAAPFDINYKQLKQTNTNTHMHALPVIETVERLIYGYKYELNRRSNKIKSLPTPSDSTLSIETMQHNSPDRSFYDLFAIIPTLWDNWYKIDQLGNDEFNEANDIKCHGVNHDFKSQNMEFWSHHHFINKYGKSNNNSIPWISDILFFAEAHIIMYNFTLLHKYKHIYFVNNSNGYTSWLSEPKNIQRVFNQYNINLTIVRTNDVNNPVYSGDRYIDIEKNQDKHNLQLITKLHWELMVHNRNPKALFNHWFTPYKLLKQHRINDHCQCFIKVRMIPLWSNNFFFFDIKNLKYLFDVLGYDLIHNEKHYYRFKMATIYPTSLYVSNKNNKYTKNHGHLFLKYYDKNSNENISIYSYPWNNKNNYRRRWKTLIQTNKTETEIKINKNINIIEITNPIPPKMQCSNKMFNKDSMIQFAKLWKLM